MAAKKEKATVPEFIDNVEALEAKMKAMREAQKVFATFTQEQVDNIITCVFEGAGKACFGEQFAIHGLHDWLGVPRGVNDGRVLGGYIDVILQTVLCPYEVIAFNENEVVYEINRKAFGRGLNMMTTAYNAYFYGMVKTLVGPEWSFWEETENVPEEIYRVKIAKKIDKFCR